MLSRLGYQFRQFSTKSPSFQEIKIPVPWGHLAGKWWGPTDQRPILTTHGWQDNSGSFDTLIPLLPRKAFLAIDFPGHGLSTPIPVGSFYHGIDCAIVIRRIVDYFKWPQVSLMGHSLGAICNYVYTILYPNTVDFLICIDGLKPLVFPDKRMERMVKTIDSFLKYDSLLAVKANPPIYEFSQLEKMLHEGTRKSIDLDKCKYILARNTLPSTEEPGKYILTRDPRLKVSELLGWAQKDIVDSAARITCPLFTSKASRSPFFEKKEQAFEVLEVIKKNNKNFEYHNVEGTHHVHLNNPERLAGLISAFINKYDIQGRSSGGLKDEILAAKI